MFIFFLCIAYKNGTKVIVFRGLPLSCHEESIYSDIKAIKTTKNPIYNLFFLIFARNRIHKNKQL